MGQVLYRYQPEQGQLLPPSLSEWVAAGHLAHFIADSVEQLDLSALYERYDKRADGRGQLAYAPRLMLKLLIYAYAVGIFSSRNLCWASGSERIITKDTVSPGFTFAVAFSRSDSQRTR